MATIGAAGSFVLISGLIDLPVSLYKTFVQEKRFGFNKMTPALWFADLCKSMLLGGCHWSADCSSHPVADGPGRPLLVGLGLGRLDGVQPAADGDFPTFIAPLFNQFKPLEDEALKQRVSHLMERCGFAAKGLFVMDGSRRSAHANAYFTGFGAAKRVVFYDTLLRQLSVGEVEAVLAHELGHFKHRHIIQRIVSMFAFSLLGFALLGWLSTQSWFYTGLGVYPAMGLFADWGSAPNDAPALLLFMLATPVFTQFISPLFSQLAQARVPGRRLRSGTNAGSRPGFSAACCTKTTPPP